VADVQRVMPTCPTSAGVLGQQSDTRRLQIQPKATAGRDCPPYLNP